MDSEYLTSNVNYGAHFPKDGELELFVRGDEVFDIGASVLAGMLSNAHRVTVRCVAKHGMDDATFRALLDLLMVSDPWPLQDSESQKLLDDFADSESRARGYDGWVVAYHKFEVEERP